MVRSVNPDLQAYTYRFGESEIFMPLPAVLTRIGDRQPATWPKDEWKKGPRCWIRIHHKPRRALFIPTGTKNGPDIATLSGSRMTKIMYLDGAKGENCADEWLTVGTQTRSLDKRWTGCSIFQLGTGRLTQPTPKPPFGLSRRSGIPEDVGRSFPKAFELFLSAATFDHPPDTSPPIDPVTPRTRLDKKCKVKSKGDSNSSSELDDYINALVVYKTRS